MKKKVILRGAALIAVAAVLLTATAPQAGELAPAPRPDRPAVINTSQWALVLSTCFALQRSLISPSYSVIINNPHLWQFCFDRELYNPSAPPNRMERLSLPKDPERSCGGENGCTMWDTP